MKKLTTRSNEISVQSLNVPLSHPYFHEKWPEIRWLSDVSKLRVTRARASKWSYSDLFSFKVEAREALIRQASMLHGESAIAGVEQPRVGEFRVRYNYQRLKVELLNRQPMSFLNPGLTLEAPFQSGFLVSSCQAGLTQLFTALDLTYGRKPVFCPGRLYYETHQMLKKFSWSLVEKAPRYKHYLFIDSSTCRTPEEVLNTQITSQTLALIIDSTCFRSSDLVFIDLLQRAFRLSIPVVLLRSHLKLDSLGLEFGRFGHVIFCAQKSSATWSTLIKTYDDLTPYFGSSVGTRQIYPFFHDSEFRRLSRLWHSRVKASNELLVRKMIESIDLEAYCYRSFYHGLFSWWRPMCSPDKQFDRRFFELRKSFLFKQIPFAMAASFPWDFTAMTTFVDPIENSDHRRFVRLSVGDFDAETSDALTSSMAEILSRVVMR